MEMELEMEWKWKRYAKSYFQYCSKNVHKFPYNHPTCSPPCTTAKLKVTEFIKDNGIDLILYKGGKVDTYSSTPAMHEVAHQI